jgi:hypothetical protein
MKTNKMKTNKTKLLLVRVTPNEKEVMITRCKFYGFSKLSEFIRVMTLKGNLNITKEK